MESTSSEVLLDAPALADSLDRLARQIHRSLPEGVPVGLIGIRSRGEVIAQRLQHMLHELGADGIAHGSLDITLYRDDLAELGPQATIKRTDIDFDISGRYLLLIDDVIFTGRSVRAALDALVDLGRPRVIRLAVLIDRPGRELPIQPDFVSVRVPEDKVPVSVKLMETDGVDEVRVG